MVDLLFALFIWANLIPRIENNRGFVDVFPRLATKEILPLEVIWRFPEPPQGLGTGPDPPRRGDLSSG